MLEVRIEKVPYSVNEKKTLNPTMRMLEFALANAGFEDGIWLLKSPHRTRKKGAERFRAMRLEGAGIRVRCKPGGNDTCYEWTLFPPAGMDLDSVFSDLCSLHPNSMRSTRVMADAGEVSIMGGLFDRIVSSRPGLLPPDIATKPEVKFSRGAEAATPEEAVEEDSPPEGFASPKEMSEETEPPMSRIGSLDLSSMKHSLSSNYAVDRALIAFWITSGGSDFSRRNILSEGLIRLLGMVGLSKNSPIYGSVKGAMRAILMACCSAGYMERLMYGENSTNGYRLTENGRKRLNFLESLLDEPLATQFRNAAAPPEEEKVPEAIHTHPDDKISVLKGLIGEHDSVKKEMEEIRQLMEELEGEVENDELMLSGLNKALAEKVGERESLNREIERLEAKMSSLRQGSEKKATDMRELKSELDRLSARKAAIELKVTG